MPERDWQADWELCQRATPGPWKIKKAKVCDYSSGKEHLATVSIGPLEIDASADDSCVCIDAWLGINEDDAYFIAEAREALLYWLQRYKELHELQEELVRLKDIILKFARYADDHKMVLVCPEEASECNSLCSACWQAALHGRKEVKQDD